MKSHAYSVSSFGASYVGGRALVLRSAVLAAATVLRIAAVVASLMPAARAARVDVLQALRSE
jgi:ABC-type lipoprotein release transport system permease subunit